MTTQTIDETKQAAFGEKMMEVMNHGFLGLTLSAGHRTGLFDSMSTLDRATSEEHARHAGLDERYVRELLGGLVTGGIVEYFPEDQTYRLPPEHAAFVTRAAGPDNIAAMLEYLGLLGSVEDQIVECARNGGGVPYSSFTRFHELMRQESGAIFDATLLESTLPLVPGLPEQLERGIDVADIGCGSGHAIGLMAEAYPASRFTGYDFSEQALGVARQEAADRGLSNATFELQDVGKLDVVEGYDLITAFDTIHDQAEPRKVLANAARALRPGGTFLMVDIAASSNLEDNIDHPLGPLMYTISTFHCMTVSLALGGEGLGTAWGEQKAQELLKEAGFTSVDVHRVEGDIQNNYYIARR